MHMDPIFGINLLHFHLLLF